MSDEENVGSLVPQLFYDLISRVVPGSIIIPVFLCSWWSPVEFWAKLQSLWASLSSEGSPSFLLGLFLLALVYFVGVALRGIAYILFLNKRFKPGRARDIDTEKYYRIKVELPSAGSRVAKMKAEVSMAEVFIAGLMLCLAVNFWGIMRADGSDRWGVSFALILCGIALASFRSEVRKRLAFSIDCHYSMLKGTPGKEQPS